MVWISYVWLDNFICVKIFPALASKAYADRIQFPCSVLLLESYKIESPLKWTFFPALIGSVFFAPKATLHKSLRPVLYLSAWCTVYKYPSALCTTCPTVHIVFANPLTSLEVAPGPFLVGSYLLVCYWKCALLLSSILSLVLQVVDMHFAHHRHALFLACIKCIHIISPAYQFNENAHSLNYFFGEFLCASLSPQLKLEACAEFVHWHMLSPCHIHCYVMLVKEGLMLK